MSISPEVARATCPVAPEPAPAPALALAPAPAAHITLYRGARNPRPERVDDFETWSDFADAVEDLVQLEYAGAPAEAKLNMRAIAPHRLKAGTSRSLANVEAVTALVIDVDKCDLAALALRIDALGIAAIVYGSPCFEADGGPLARRVRVLAPIDRETTPDECAHVRLAFAEVLGLAPGCGVEGALDASRIFFAGRVAGTPAREWFTTTGAPQNVDDLLARTVAPEWRSTKAAPKAEVNATSDAEPRALSEQERRAKGELIAFTLGLPHSIAGKNGERTLFESTNKIAEKLGEEGENAEAILELLTTTYNPHCCKPPWDLNKLKYEAERAAERQATPEARYARRKREARETEGRANEATPDAPPILAVTRVGGSPSYFVRDWRTANEGGASTYVECGRHAVHATIRACAKERFPVHRSERGGLRSVQELTDTLAVTIDAVEWDFARQGRIEFDPATNKMLCGITCPEIAPVHDADVAAWLEAFAGSAQRLAALHEWIASTRQDQIGRLATALLIVGPHGVGKSIFAIACARLWGMAAPVNLGAVVKQFNASMTSGPIVADDECKTLARCIVSTEEFRSIIQERSRSFEPKNKEMRTLHGAQRFILSTNDLGAFKFSNVLGVGAVDAIAERLLQIVVPEAGADSVRALLARVGDGHEVDLDRLVGHFAWIRENTKIPGGEVRFLGSDPDKAGARSAIVASTLDAHEALFDMIRRALEGEHVDGLAFASGALWVRRSVVASRLSATGERWDVARVTAAIAPFKGPREYYKVEGAAVRAVELVLARLAPALGMDPATVARATAEPAKSAEAGAATRPSRFKVAGR